MRIASAPLLKLDERELVSVLVSDMVKCVYPGSCGGNVNLIFNVP